MGFTDECRMWGLKVCGRGLLAFPREPEKEQREQAQPTWLPTQLLPEGSSLHSSSHLQRILGESRTGPQTKHQRTAGVHGQQQPGQQDTLQKETRTAITPDLEFLTLGSERLLSGEWLRLRHFSELRGPSQNPGHPNPRLTSLLFSLLG